MKTVLTSLVVLAIVASAGAQQRNDVQEWQVSGRYTDVDVSLVRDDTYTMHRRHHVRRVVRHRRHH